MYDYLLSLPDEVSPTTSLKLVLETICAFRLNTSGGVENPGVSPSHSFGFALCADHAVFYMFLAVCVPCLNYGAS